MTTDAQVIHCADKTALVESVAARFIATVTSATGAPVPTGTVSGRVALSSRRGQYALGDP